MARKGTDTLIDELIWPTISDAPETLLGKLRIYKAALDQGYPLSEMTRNKALPESSQELRARVRNEMSPLEREDYDIWIAHPERIRLPDVDWNIAQPFSKPFAKAKKYVGALNRLYKTDKARPEHYNWIVVNHVHILPLVNAIGRVIAAEQHLRTIGGPREEMPKATAEFRTIEAILKVSRAVMSAAKKPSDRKQISSFVTDFGKSQFSLVNRA